MVDTWTTVEWAAFEYLGPQGMDVSFLRTGSLEDDDGKLDTNRKSARNAVKDNKKHNHVEAFLQTDENVTARAAIAWEMGAHIKMANKRLILLFGAPKDKAQVIRNVMADLTNAPDVGDELVEE